MWLHNKISQMFSHSWHYYKNATNLPVHLPACLPKCTESAHTAHLVALMLSPIPHLCGMLCFIRCLRRLLPPGVCGILRLLLAGVMRAVGLGWFVGDIVMAERRRLDWGVAGGWCKFTVEAFLWAVMKEETFDLVQFNLRRGVQTSGKKF